MHFKMYRTCTVEKHEVLSYSKRLSATLPFVLDRRVSIVKNNFRFLFIAVFYSIAQVLCVEIGYQSVLIDGYGKRVIKIMTS